MALNRLGSSRLEACNKTELAAVEQHTYFQGVFVSSLYVVSCFQSKISSRVSNDDRVRYLIVHIASHNQRVEEFLPLTLLVDLDISDTLSSHSRA